jgi:hypothetical protein
MKLSSHIYKYFVAVEGARGPPCLQRKHQIPLVPHDLLLTKHIPKPNKRIDAGSGTTSNDVVKVSFKLGCKSTNILSGFLERFRRIFVQHGRSSSILEKPSEVRCSSSLSL